jgi:hypothetical protein
MLQVKLGLKSRGQIGFVARYVALLTIGEFWSCSEVAAAVLPFY